MKNIIRAIGLLYIIVGVAWADACNLDDLLKKLRNDLTEEFKNVEENAKATNMAKLLKDKGMSDYSYMSKWELGKESQRGPWAMKGNTLVAGIKATDTAKWVEEIGNKSFGFGFMGHPNTAHPSALLRIQDKIYYYDSFQSATSSDGLWNSGMKIKEYLEGYTNYTESTFMATEEEIQAIKKFFEARATSQIKAKRKISGKIWYGDTLTVEVGEPIRPKFDYNGESLVAESCMSACTSFLSPAWLSHYDMPESLKLATLASTMAIRPNRNAKAAIFDHFRNPNASAMTVLGIDELSQGNFVKEVTWKNTRGIMWAFIPDLAENESSKLYKTQRIPVTDWLNSIND